MQVKILKDYKYYRPVVTQDEEANSMLQHVYQGVVSGNVYPAGGEVRKLAQTHQLDYSLVLLSNQDVLQENDCLCIYKEEMDYQVVSINRYSKHVEIGLKSL